MVALMTTTWRRRASRAIIGRVLVAGTVFTGGCSGTLEALWPDRQPAYKSSKSASPLELPPDLTTSAIRDTLPVPGVEATYSQYAGGEGTAAAPSEPAVLPTVDNARIERSGDQRWLVAAMTPDDAWPRLHDFWLRQGFSIETHEPEVGVMETDWAEQHTALPAGAVTKVLNALSNALYGVTIRDRYRTRIERGVEPGTIEIYISHRGAEQEVIGDETHDARKEGLGKRVWQPRPNDPGLEAEMLTRLMIFLGVDEDRADTLVAASASPGSRARLVREDDGTAALVLEEKFSTAWRHVGLALDRAGFTVEDRDRSRGLYFVRYEAGADDPRSENAGWLSRLKFWGSDGNEQGDQAYVVRVVGDTSPTTRVVVLDRNGVRDESQAGSRILAVLHEQLE